MGTIIPNMGIKRADIKSGKNNSKRLADALFTKVQQRVLGVLFGNPGRSFYANEIISLAESGTGAVQRELTRLAGAGLLKVTRSGNQKHYQANEQSCVFGELRGIVMKTSGLADVIRSGLDKFAENIKKSFVFGSVAKGEDSATSDIDLLVISDSLTYADVFSALDEAGKRLGRTINPTVYSTKEYDDRLRKENAFVRRVMEQPKLWIIGGDNDQSP